MKIVIAILVIIVQIVAAQILGFGGAMALSAGNGLELVVFVLGDTLGVWGTGWVATRLLGSRYFARATTTRLIATITGAALGIAAILITPPLGLGQIGFPLLGALLGYYLAALIRR
jgi:hypothetical protein